MKSILYIVVVLCLPSFLIATPSIRLNQIGFYTESQKIAIIVGSDETQFTLRTASTNTIVYTGILSASATWSFSGESVKIADFSEFTTPGRYRLVVIGIGGSYAFNIGDMIHRDLSKASIKAFYYNRSSTALFPEHAGVWARASGHSDTAVRVHSSAATTNRPANSTISSPKGWYDAGDYGKYIVNSGISTYTLLAAYEHFPEYYNTLELNIPESGNGIPDLLDEVKWNVDWMLTMQDPDDGGVYHKLTTPNFPGIIMPNTDLALRYVVRKSTSATLNFAAVMAVASRVYRQFDHTYADQCLAAAKAAWTWAVQNPTVYYNQSNMNLSHSPAINTGEYGDGNVTDEFDWAAAELYITTKEDHYYTTRNLSQVGSGVPAWPFTRPLAWVSLAHHMDDLTSVANKDVIRQRIVQTAATLRNGQRNSAYRVAMGTGGNGDFVWGSNGTVGNQAMMLIQAYRLTADSTYLDAAMANLDYLLGRNGTGFSFVTGFGTFSTMKPHHRPSEADGVVAPVPGFVAGGPNPGIQDGCPGYPSTLPARAYIDTWCSYATNEIAINWNAPLAYVAGAIEAIKEKKLVSIDEKSTGFANPSNLELHQNYPNPFNPSTKISYRLAVSGRTKLTVYDNQGRQVAVLVDEMMRVGTHSATFDASGMASGVYVYRLQVDGFSKVGRMALVK